MTDNRVVKICITTFIFIWCGFLSIALARKVCKFKNPSRNINKPTLTSTFTCYIGWCISYSLTALHYIYQFDGPLYTATFSIFSVVYSISYASSYTFVVLISYNSFKDSDYSMRKCTMIMHIILLIILFASCTSASFFLYVIPNYLGGMLTFLNVTFYTFGLCSIMISVNIKLIQMILLCDEKPEESSFFVAITKLSVLTTIFTVTSIIYVFTAIIHHLILSDNQLMEVIEWIVYGVTVFMGTLCMYLTYAFNKKEYSIVCKNFNNGFSKCCVWTMHKLVDSQTVQESIAEKRATVTMSTAPAIQLAVHVPSASRVRGNSLLSSPISPVRQLTPMSPKLEQIKEEFETEESPPGINIPQLNSLFHRTSAGKSNSNKSKKEFTEELIAHDSIVATPEELINIETFETFQAFNVANQTLTLAGANAKSHPLFARNNISGNNRNIPQLKFRSLSTHTTENEFGGAILNGNSNDEREGTLVIISDEVEIDSKPSDIDKRKMSD